MQEITVQDCEELKRKFDDYCENAEQHQFPLLLMINLKMDATLEHIRAAGKVENQKDTRAMFRIVLKAIGEDATKYQESEG